MMTEKMAANKPSPWSWPNAKAIASNYWLRIKTTLASLLKPGHQANTSVNVQLIWLLVISAFVIALLFSLMLWWHDRDFRPLYGQGEHYNMAGVVEILDKQGIDYRINPDNGLLLVRGDRLSAARMAMAAGGIVAPATAESPLLQEKQALGSSHFMEQMRYLATLEVSLSATIASLQAVRNVRVHLAVPEQSVFFRERPAAKASVYLELFSGTRLQPEQVEGIMRLISGSVAGLEEQQVTVVDQYGNLLSQSLVHGLSGSDEGISRQYLAARTRIETHLEMQLAKILDAVVGAGNYRADVAAELTLDRQEQNSERFGPATVLRSESIESGTPGLTNLQQGQQGLPAVAEVPANTPVAGSGETPGEQKIIRNYEVNRLVSNETRYPGQVKRLTVAVVINAGDFGPPSLPESQAKLTALVKQAVGFDAERGDEVSIGILPFATPVPPPAENKVDLLAPWVDLAIKTVLFIALIAAIIMCGLWFRQRILSPGPASETVSETETTAAIPDTRFPPASLEEHIDQLRNLTLNEPEKVATVLKQWIASNQYHG
ncbi:flagellar basal-body MS-ring/collar protein FliF [Endozoicomonas sp.]|uniref:flagellar basal-body MS-ring/collar protein FliF n=1 Tax=Endozoicomonas sp. TaxID=1892382 RepID=UPI002888DF61|nr:flagellar basal-body MS-ring/collar protein FliF [Endozoicomonas sp.]